MSLDLGFVNGAIDTVGNTIDDLVYSEEEKAAMELAALQSSNALAAAQLNASSATAKKEINWGLILGIGIPVLLIGGGFIYWITKRRKKK